MRDISSFRSFTRVSVFIRTMLTMVVILPLLAFSCSEMITVHTRFVNIDSDEDTLKLHFDFKRARNNEIALVHRIDLFRNDTLVCRLTSKTSMGISEWDFPSIPKDFRIESSILENGIQEIQKDENITFGFRGQPGYGSWDYRPEYSDPQLRGMFDDDGNQTMMIDCYYEPWIGKDIIRIESSKAFPVTASDFELRDASGESVKFEVKYKRNPTNRVALVLERSEKKGAKLDLRFKLNPTQVYKKRVVVPDKSTVWIAGKFSDL